MARGFGATLGVGATDKITSVLTTQSTQRSWGIWTYRRLAAPGVLQRMFDRAVDTGANQRLYTASDGSVYVFDVAWSGALGSWNVPSPASGMWHHVLITYDSSSSTNDPMIYIDGAGVTVTRGNTPSGTPTSDSSAIILGNRNSNDRVWDGMLADFGVWDRILASWEVMLLGGTDHYAVSAFPTNLVEYIFMPDVGSPTSTFGAPTVTGTAVQPSPPINYTPTTPPTPWMQSSPILAQ